ncbi:hypothetical protein OS493_038260 [Desmophyllum pertusum]|uniref:Uncharacterized protein n=1 Tax=Desmophyllum pertusum TaxID=174260 RepID=A0A9X0CZS9_9CNID|nr:hypothetical protein OS493_038260 [Desmophyllum pertusum]
MFMGGRMAELMRNKEGLTITDQLDLGSVMVGESKSMIVWISNKGEKGHIFQSCTSVRDDPQFSVQLANTPSTQSDVKENHQRNRSVAVEDLLLQGSFVSTRHGNSS